MFRKVIPIHFPYIPYPNFVLCLYFKFECGVIGCKVIQDSPVCNFGLDVAGAEANVNYRTLCASVPCGGVVGVEDHQGVSKYYFFQLLSPVIAGFVSPKGRVRVCVGA